MGRCTGRRCPAQVGYDVANCNQFDCIYRTEINTNYDRIKSMSVEEMAVNLAKIQCDAIAQTVPITVTEEARQEQYELCKQWLLQEVNDE
jgi:hypothetical protein